MTHREGLIEVTGGSLNYRLCGTPGQGPLLVFENGWSASWHMWAWVEPLLAPHAQLLFYSRAGIGGSQLHAPQTVTGMSRQLAELLAALKVERPVIAVGQSYGGLMCALHAAQLPGIVDAVVLVDATSPYSEPVIDKQLRAMHGVGSLMVLCARLGLTLPPFAAAGRSLPQTAGSLLVQQSFGSAPSLRAAIGELVLLPGIHEAIAKVDHGQRRLVISAGKASEPQGWIGRLMVSSEKARDFLGRMRAQSQRYAARSAQGRWMELPYTHGDLVFTEAGSVDVSACIREFIKVPA